MKFGEFIDKATLTAVYPGIRTYPTLGLVDEAGELLDAVHDGDERHIQDEAGDVLWYVAMTAADWGINALDGIELDLMPPMVPMRDGHRATIAAGILRRASKIAGMLKKHMRDDKNVRHLISGELQVIVGWMSSIVPIDAVAQGNIEKLSSRQERGKIHGDGDDR